MALIVEFMLWKLALLLNYNKALFLSLKINNFATLGLLCLCACNYFSVIPENNFLLTSHLFIGALKTIYVLFDNFSCLLLELIRFSFL